MHINAFEFGGKAGAFSHKRGNYLLIWKFCTRETYFTATMQGKLGS